MNNLSKAGEDRSDDVVYRLRVVPFLAAALLVAWQAALIIKQDLTFTRVETEITFWGKDNYQPAAATVRHTEQALQQLLDQSPSNPEYLGLAANFRAWQAWWADDPLLAEQFALQAVLSQYQAQQSRPAYRQGWSKMIAYTRRAADTEAIESLSLKALQRQQALLMTEPVGVPDLSGLSDLKQRVGE